MDNTDEDIDVQKMDVGNDSVFVANVEDRLRTEEFEDQMRQAWRNLWRHRQVPPRLLIIPEGVKLTALSDADLRRVGLLRVEATP